MLFFIFGVCACGCMRVFERKRLVLESCAHGSGAHSILAKVSLTIFIKICLCVGVCGRACVCVGASPHLPASPLFPASILTQPLIYDAVWQYVYVCE